MAIGVPYTIAGAAAASGSATLQVTVSATSVAGDAIVVCASTNAGSGQTVTAMADSQGNSYAQVTGANVTISNLAASVWVALNTTPLASGTDWIRATFSGTGGGKCLNGRGCSGIATSSAQDATAHATGTSTSPSSGSSGTLSQASEWAVAFLVNASAGGSPTAWTGGYTAADTEHTGSNQYQTAADQTVSSTTALTAGATITSAAWAILEVTLKGANQLTLVNNFEEGSNTTTVTTGNSGGSGQNAFGKVSIGTGAGVTFDNTHAAHGTLACKIATAASAFAFVEWAASLGSQAQVWFRIYCYFTASPASDFGLVRYLTATAGNQCARLALTSAGKLTFNDGPNNVQLTSTNTIPLNAWFRVEGYCTGSSTTGKLEFKLFDSPDSTSPTETQTSGSSLNTQGPVGAADFGISGLAIGSETFWMDDIGVSNAGYIGPAGAGAAASNLLLLFP